MKLLICTQAIDSHDPALSFFILWVQELAKHFESIEVLCLRTGEYTLPENVMVHELGGGKLKRVARLLRLSGSLEYSAVFVHMSQEFVVASGWLWKFRKKPVYMWRNHYRGDLRTDLAAFFCKKIFCTSKYSYTAKYKNTVFMPVGVDTKTFAARPGVKRTPHSILFLSRITPAKHADTLIDALRQLHNKGIEFRASVYGAPAPRDERYYQALKQSASGLPVTFYGAVSNSETPPIYSAHEIFVNCSPSGMFDKTLFEAASCGCLVVAASKDFATLVPPHFSFKEGDAQDLAHKLEILCKLSDSETQEARNTMQTITTKHSLSALVEKLSFEIR